jgi:hypothetical protein
LVKLASLGASGVCVLAIFWVGWLISKLPKNANPEHHKTMRLYMGMTVVIAVIAFASGLANAWFNSEKIATIQQKNDTLANKYDSLRADADKTIKNYESDRIRNIELLKSLAVVIDEKELATKEQGASPILQSHINILKKSMDRLKSVTDSEKIPD